MEDKSTQELAENVTVAAKIDGDRIAKAFAIFNENVGAAKSAFVGLGKTLDNIQSIKGVSKKKRGAGYTKRRVCRRTGKSSSH